MKCPYCSNIELKVVDKRESEELNSTRRRRECLKCGKRFTTYERIEGLPIVVIKKDGNRQSFDREKLIRGLMRACEKRPISLKEIEEIVEQIESEIRSKFEGEIPSKRVGELVMKKLKKLDGVSYVRFASVYREFKDANEFVEELEKYILKKKKKD